MIIVLPLLPAIIRRILEEEVFKKLCLTFFVFLSSEKLSE